MKGVSDPTHSVVPHIVLRTSAKITLHKSKSERDLYPKYR